MVVGRRGTGQRDGARSKGFNRLKCGGGKGRKGSQTSLVTRNCKQKPSTGLQKDFYVKFKFR